MSPDLDVLRRRPAFQPSPTFSPGRSVWTTLSISASPTVPQAALMLTTLRQQARWCSQSRGPLRPSADN